MSAIDTEPFPRWPLIAAGVLVAISIAGASFVRLSKISQSTETGYASANAALPGAQAVRARTVRFEGTPGESLRLVDIANGASLGALSPETDGFIHGVMRGLRRTRMIQGAQLNPELDLVLWSDGRLTATDRQTGTMIDLTAFGADNRRAFEILLPAATTSAASTKASQDTRP